MQEISGGNPGRKQFYLMQEIFLTLKNWKLNWKKISRTGERLLIA